MFAKLFKLKVSISVLIFVLIFLILAAVYSLISKSNVKVAEKVQKAGDNSSYPAASKNNRHKTGKPDSTDLDWGTNINQKDIQTKFDFEVKLPSERVKELTGNLKTVIAKKTKNDTDKSDGVILYFDNDKLEIWEESEGGYLNAEEEMEGWKNNDDYERWKKEYQLVEINGVKGLGREPGTGRTEAGDPSPGVVFWTKDGKIEYKVYGDGIPVKDLLTIAESLE